MNNLLEKIYNPDVLSCLANLSNDEVFTPPEVANKMIDLLPKELFESDATTFLDPCCKSGVFLREIMKRLLNAQMPNYEEKIMKINEKRMNKEKITTEDEKYEQKLQEKIDHICHKQLFGISITKLTALLSRRSLYCSKNANSKYSISKFTTDYGNIMFVDIEHTFKNGKCIYCGASESEYGKEKRGDELESHAYQFIHDEKMVEELNMRFDVIIGNPPYQLSIAGGGSSDRAIPVYNKFIEQAVKLNPRFISMIIPSKWMVGGFGLKGFREYMCERHDIKELVDYEDSSFCFPGLHIDSGVCYFLIDRSYNGDVKYTFIDKSNNISTNKRKLKNDYFPYIIRDYEIYNILDKVKKYDKFSTLVSTLNPYGIPTFIFNEPKRMPEIKLSDNEFNNSLKVYGVKGIKGGAKRQTGFIKNILDKNININTYKIFFSATYSTGAINFPDPIIALPNEVCTATFLKIGDFKSLKTLKNCLSYMNTNLFKFLLFYGKGTMHVTKDTFGLIPLLDFDKEWNDEKVFNEFKFNKNDIEYINKFINSRNNGIAIKEDA
ncbi:MAG: Eco57I restriction-modification methylase domain-containing protein [Lachnospiraceae bacterium]|nr:Eco57I restriction-modification methylase domain-containing protein [Lachnospiraceae bacterium]